MTRPASRTVRTTVAGLAAGLVVTLSSALSLTLAAPAHADNVVTPGDFTGYGFDQCLAPKQWEMNRWLEHSPFLAVGIYISGDSRACRNQPNLTPSWVGKQLRRGWRLLPITLGPQASCQPRFPRYGDDETIIPKRGTDGRYGLARGQGQAEADKAVAAASESEGAILAVTDREILGAYKRLAHEGLFAELASAASVAGMLHLFAEERLPKGATVVCVLTGHGLKDPDIMAGDEGSMAIVPPDTAMYAYDFVRLLIAATWRDPVVVSVNNTSMAARRRTGCQHEVGDYP